MKNGISTLVVFLFVTGCGLESTPPEREAHESEESLDESIVEIGVGASREAGIRIAPVRAGNLGAHLETTGQVDFDQDRIAHLGPRLPGRAHRVPVTLGQTVQEGQTLAVIDSIELGSAKASYLRARARSELAGKIHGREQELYRDRIASEQEALTAEAAYREAATELATAREMLRLYGLGESEIGELRYEDPRASLFAIRSPLAGKVVEKEVVRGEVVRPDRRLFTVADLSRVWIWIDLHEESLRRVETGDPVEVRLDAFPEGVFRGKVSYLADRMETESRTLRARVDVENPDGKLRPGMFARVRVTPERTAERNSRPVPIVPEAAVQRDGEAFVVFVPAGERRFQKREVRLGHGSAGLVEVLEGLTEGEEVVVEGAFLLKSQASRERLGGHAH